MASVVFPAIGTGNLGFPKDLVARIMLTEFQEFNATNLREVTVIVHPSDKESIQVSEGKIDARTMKNKVKVFPIT